MDPASVDQTWTYSNICQVGFQQRGGGGGDGEEGVGKLSPRRRSLRRIPRGAAAHRAVLCAVLKQLHPTWQTLGPRLVYRSWIHLVYTLGVSVRAG